MQGLTLWSQPRAVPSLPIQTAHVVAAVAQNLWPKALGSSQGGFVHAQLSCAAFVLLRGTWPRRLEEVMSPQPSARAQHNLHTVVPLSVPQQFFSVFFISGRTRSLLSLCRIAVRRILGKSRLDLIHILPIPDPIKQFLLHEHS